MSETTQSPEIRAVVRDGVVRAVAAIGLCGVALIHLLDFPGKFDETPYMGVMYLGLMVGSLGLAAALVYTSDSRAWAASGALVAAVIVGYVLSRTTGLPQASDDIGNWSEPLGIASLFVEGSLVALTSGVLFGRRRGLARSVPASRRESRDLLAA